MIKYLQCFLFICKAVIVHYYGNYSEKYWKWKDISVMEKIIYYFDNTISLISQWVIEYEMGKNEKKWKNHETFFTLMCISN